jgi:hypothetical protein
MGSFANGRWTNLAAIAGTVFVLLLNIPLILQAFGVPIPGLAAQEATSPERAALALRHENAN